MNAVILFVAAVGAILLTMKYVWTANTARKPQPVRISIRSQKRRS